MEWMNVVSTYDARVCLFEQDSRTLGWVDGTPSCCSRNDVNMCVQLLLALGELGLEIVDLGRLRLQLAVHIDDLGGAEVRANR